MAQDAPVLALSDIMHTMSPSPAPQFIDDSLDTTARPSSHSPEPLDAAQIEAMRKRAVELSLQGKMSMSAKEKELAIMVLRLTSCSVPDVSQILAQADTISDLTRQRDFLYKEIEEERARWEAEKLGFERIAEALIGKRSRGGDSTYREEELERHVAILDADNKALRSKISEYHARMQTVEAELAQLRPVLLMQPFALTHTVQHPHTQPASYTFVGPSYKAERSSKRRKHAQPPPQATDRDQDATEEEGDDAGPSTIATPKQRPQKGDYYRRRDTDVFTETTKHRRHRPKKGSTMLADARAEHLLLAARKVGKERAAILAGIASGPERDHKKEDDSTTATPRTPKRSQAVPVTGGTMGIMYLNSPAPAPATPSAAPAASTSQPMQTPQPASRTVATQKAPAPDRPAVTNPRTPLDSLLTAARSISMIEDEDDDAEEEDYGEPAAGPSNLTKPLTRGRVAELQGSPVSVKRRRVAAPLTTLSISRSRDTGAAARKDSVGGAGRAEETTRRTRSGLDVLADQAAAAFSSEKDKSMGRGKGKGKAKARDVSEVAEGSRAAAGAVNGRKSAAAGMVTRARGERAASGRTQSPASVASGTRKGKGPVEDAAAPARRTKAAARTRAPPPEADRPAGPSTSQDVASSASGSGSAPPQLSASDSAPRSSAGEAMDVDDPGDTTSAPVAAVAPGAGISEPAVPTAAVPAVFAPTPTATTPPMPTTAPAPAPSSVPAPAPSSVPAPDPIPAAAPPTAPPPSTTPDPAPEDEGSLSAAEDQDAEGEPDTLE